MERITKSRRTRAVRSWKGGKEFNQEAEGFLFSESHHSSGLCGGYNA